MIESLARPKSYCRRRCGRGPCPVRFPRSRRRRRFSSIEFQGFLLFFSVFYGSLKFFRVKVLVIFRKKEETLLDFMKTLLDFTSKRRGKA